MCLCCCWKDLDEQDLMEFICEDLGSECGRYRLLVNSATENSNEFRKTRFWKEKSFEDMVTLKWLTIQLKHDVVSDLALQKKIDTYIAKQCSHVESFAIL
jgi:hypothetical protein